MIEISFYIKDKEKEKGNVGINSYFAGFPGKNFK